MKVKELIEKLSKYDSELEVIIESANEYLKEFSYDKVTKIELVTTREVVRKRVNWDCDYVDAVYNHEDDDTLDTKVTTCIIIE